MSSCHAGTPIDPSLRPERPRGGSAPCAPAGNAEKNINGRSRSGRRSTSAEVPNSRLKKVPGLRLKSPRRSRRRLAVGRPGPANVPCTPARGPAPARWVREHDTSANPFILVVRNHYIADRQVAGSGRLFARKPRVPATVPHRRVKARRTIVRRRRRAGISGSPRRRPFRSARSARQSTGPGRNAGPGRVRGLLPAEPGPRRRRSRPGPDGCRRPRSGENRSEPAVTGSAAALTGVLRADRPGGKATGPVQRRTFR